MVSVNTNIASLQSQSALRSTQGDFENSMLRLSTGKRINGAADDAAGLSVTSSMTAQIKGLKMASKNASDGISLVNTVEGALNESTNILQRIRELAVQSASDTNSGNDRAYIQDEINQLNNELNRIANTTEYNGIKVLNGSFNSKTLQVGNLGHQTIKFDINNADTSTLGAYQIKSLDSAIGVAVATKALAVSAATAMVSGGADYVVKGFFGSETAGVAAGANARDTASAFNLISATTGVKATAQTRVEIKATLNGSAASGETYNFDLYGKSDSASNVTAAITSVSDLTALKDAINSVSGATAITATLTADKSAVHLTNDEGYNIIFGDVTATTSAYLTVAAMDQAGTVDGNAKILKGNTTLTDSAAIFGQVVLSGDKPFTVTPGDDDNLFGADDAIVSATLADMASIDVKSVSGATDAIAVVDMSLNMIAASRSKLGALQNRLSSTVENLSTIIAKTEQSRSRILDADFASETTALSKSQILQQASTAMLAQANQANQGVLRLLQAG